MANDQEQAAVAPRTLQKTGRHTDTATDPWQATTPEERAQAYTRGMFLKDLDRVSRRLTDEINNDPAEVLRLRAAQQEVAAGKTRPYRKRATKSD